MSASGAGAAGEPQDVGLPVSDASDIFGAVGRCWYCYKKFSPSGTCETKGCRPASSGFHKRVRVEGPCVRCGSLTQRRVVTAMESGVHQPGGEELVAHGVHFCDACDHAWRVAKGWVLAEPPAP